MTLKILLLMTIIHVVNLISSLFSNEGTTILKYKIPTRGLLGLRNAILTASRGTAILNTIFDSYGPWAGDMSTRDLGSLVTTTTIGCLDLCFVTYDMIIATLSINHQFY